MKEEPPGAEDGTHVPCWVVLVGGKGQGPSIAHGGVLIRVTQGGGRHLCPLLVCPFKWAWARANHHPLDTG